MRSYWLAALTGPIAGSESGIVRDRESLRGFLTDPRQVAPGTIMPVRVSDEETLERLLDYLETLR